MQRSKIDQIVDWALNSVKKDITALSDKNHSEEINLYDVLEIFDKYTSGKKQDE